MFLTYLALNFLTPSGWTRLPYWWLDGGCSSFYNFKQSIRRHHNMLNRENTTSLLIAMLSPNATWCTLASIKSPTFQKNCARICIVLEYHLRNATRSWRLSIACLKRAGQGCGCWAEVRELIWSSCILCGEFLSARPFWITPIPKREKAESIKDYRPISLVETVRVSPTKPPVMVEELTGKMVAFLVEDAMKYGRSNESIHADKTTKSRLTSMTSSTPISTPNMIKEHLPISNDTKPRPWYALGRLPRNDAWLCILWTLGKIPGKPRRCTRCRTVRVYSFQHFMECTSCLDIALSICQRYNVWMCNVGPSKWTLLNVGIPRSKQSGCKLHVDQWWRRTWQRRSLRRLHLKDGEGIVVL